MLAILRHNRNYRYTWVAQVVSEIGDHFNNIAVLALVMEKSGSGLVVSGIMLARAIPAAIAGPIAGVALDRMDRKRIMIASDLVRAAIALGFILTVGQPRPWLLYALSAGLMFASPFFTSGRSSILPVIVTGDELHAANSLTQTTQWATQSAGTLLAGASAWAFGYAPAFVINSLSFLLSALLIWKGVRAATPGGFRAERKERNESAHGLRPWHEYREGLRYMKSVPLIASIALLSAGWAIGGGAAQILFALFGEQVFHRGAAGIGILAGAAGIGLLIGGGIGHEAGRKLSFTGYKRTVAASYLLHGAAYMAFSETPSFAAAIALMAVSRVGMAVTTVLNGTALLRHTPDVFRGRVFATLESVRWSVMLFSMAAAGFASEYVSARTIGLAAGIFGALTAVAWMWRDWRGRLPEPAPRFSSPGTLMNSPVPPISST